MRSIAWKRWVIKLNSLNEQEERKIDSNKLSCLVKLYFLYAI